MTKHMTLSELKSLMVKHYENFDKESKIYKKFHSFRQDFCNDKENDDVDWCGRYFIISIEHGYRTVAKWLYNLFPIDNHDFSRAFVATCIRNKEINKDKNMREWLYNLSKVDNKKLNLENAFRSACGEGYKDIAEWLYNISKKDNNKIDIHTYNEHPFRLACDNGHKETAQWLYDISKNDNNGKIDIHVSKEGPFRAACLNNHKETAQWLYNLSKTDGNTKIDIKRLDKFFFKCLEYTNGNIRKWAENLLQS